MYCFSTFCICCLNAENNLKYLTSTDTDSTQLLNKFMYCCLLEKEVSKYPSLSACSNCIENMKRMYKFKNMCKINQDIFTAFLEFEEKNLKASENVRLTTIQKFIKQLSIDDHQIKTEPTNYTSEEETENLPTKVPQNTSNLHTLSKSNNEQIINDEFETIVKVEDASSITIIKNELASPIKPADELVPDESAAFETIFLRDEPADSESSSCEEDDDLKTFKCHICVRKFTRKACLQKHMVTHTGEKSHHCTICAKNFSLKSNLRTHMLIHTGTKPHKCDLCNRSFSHKSNLYTHRLVHTGEKKHQCNVCQKSFTKKSNYKTHMIIHTEERPHRCEKCKKCFRLKSHLKRHMHTCIHIAVSKSV